MVFLTFSLFSQKANNISAHSTHYTTENGLSNQNTNYIFQDSRGFIWIATEQGFSRFDGKKFINYSPEILDFSFKSIVSIHEDTEGLLWLFEVEKTASASVRKMLVFNPYTEKIKQYQLSSTEEVSAIATTPDRQIILGTTTGKIILINAEKEQIIYQTEEQKAVQEIVASTDFFWLNDKQTVTVLNKKGKFIRVWKTENSYSYAGLKDSKSLYVRDLHLDGGDRQNEQILSLKTDIVKAQIAAINERIEQLAAAESIRYFSDEKMFVIYNNGGKITCVKEESGEEILLEIGEGSARDFEVKDVYFDENGMLWIASNSGIYKIRFVTTPFAQYLHSETSKSTEIKSIKAIGDSLFCMTSKGKVIFDIKDKKVLEKEDAKSSSIEKNQIYYQAQTRDGTGKIWLVNERGLFSVNSKKEAPIAFKKYNQFPELKGVPVFNIFASDSVVWVASKKGLYKIKTEAGVTEWYHSGEPTPGSRYLPTDAVFGIYQDTEGILWLTTEGSGLIRLDPQNSDYQQIMVKDGLSHNVTNDVLEDDAGYLWISTKKGISRLNRSNGSLKNFDKSDGLPFTEFSINSSAKTEEGKLIFGGINGIILFDPQDFLGDKKQELEYHLRVTEVVIDDRLIRALDPVNPIRVQNNVEEITLKFSLLQYENEQPVTYSWKWKGSDSFEKLASSQLVLTDIPRGLNTIQIRAVSKNMPALLDLEVNIDAPLFLLRDKLFLFGLFSAVFFYFIYRNRKAKKDDKISPVTLQNEKEETQLQIVDKVKIETANIENIPKEPEEITLNETDQKWLTEMTSVAEKQLKEGASSVEELAGEMNISSRQLNRKVKQLTGRTPNQFLRDIKLAKAKKMLENGTVSTVAEASAAVGFEKPDYFSRLFKEKYGVRPVRYFGKK